MKIIVDIAVVAAFWLAKAIFGALAFLFLATLILKAAGPVLPVLLEPLFAVLPADPDDRFSVSLLLAAAAVLVCWAIRDRTRLKSWLHR
ncbi:MAG: hypothetical protein HYU77_01135 [Betaproteobacteria bacterium]|nr:hypothetical protein [Betaproteobacteria bacterium]